MKTKKLNENKGITLTALVVAIIVLIILASISITSINGQRDTIEEAQAVKVSAEVATYQEELDIIEIKTVADQIDEDGNVLLEMNPYIAELEPGESTTLNTSATFDYANAYDFTIEKKSE